MIDSKFSVVSVFGGPLLQRTASSYEFVCLPMYADIIYLLFSVEM
jgi:hypothetical protein